MRAKKALLAIGMIMGAFALVRNATGIQNRIAADVEFTLEPTMSITIPSEDVLLELAPGRSGRSTPIQILLETNNVAGAVLKATVGNNEYNTTSLENKVAGTSIASVAVGSSVSSLASDTWGYSRGMSGPYSGLPLYNSSGSPVELGRTSSVGTLTYDFVIGANVSTGTLSGDYKNVINFIVAANVSPQTLAESYEAAGKGKWNGYYKMQDMNSSICSATEAVDKASQMQAIDTRDGKVYWITKLQDGNCWMTQNLAHDISTNFEYTSANTDIGSSWSPSVSTSTDISDWINSNTTPASYNPGDNLCWDGKPLDWNYVTGTLDDATVDCDDKAANWRHYSIGNYYNWAAAVAMNDTSGVTQIAHQSICPAGWILPIRAIFNNVATTYSNYSYYGNPLYFVLSGYLGFDSQSSNVGVFTVGSTGRFTTQQLANSDSGLVTAVGFVRYDDEFITDSNTGRNAGLSVRCMAK